MRPLARFFFFCCLILSGQLAFGQTTPTAKPQTLTLNHIAVHVSNLEKSTLFYEQVLQLKKIPEPFKDGLHTWFSIGAAGQLHLIQGAEASSKHNKNAHLCFSVPSIENFITNLEQHKIEYTNWPGTAKAPTVRVDGVKQIYFQDPDGNWLEINNDSH